MRNKGNENLFVSDKDMIERVEEAALHYGRFLNALGFHYQNDPNMEDTPKRVAKSYAFEILRGCFSEKPKISTFPSTGYEGIVCQTFIPIKSMCSHHSLPIVGYAHISYLPGAEVIGLSKLNRIAEWVSRRFQLQEALTHDILKELGEVLPSNKGVAVIVSARHFCTCHRGVNHDSVMTTMEVSGLFLTNDAGCKDEFFRHIELNKSMR